MGMYMGWAVGVVVHMDMYLFLSKATNHIQP
jgi:hypothetical protein